ncbi:5-methylcytosine-specific restriction protein A [Paraburkholderia sp. WC7.3g]|uniref:HNH endonuclease n=1 Tax=Paraburkholderia sp. WC7.3g TaxID=2991070 RepID=UPI003D25EACB
MTTLDGTLLARGLEDHYGVAFSAGVENVDGGSFIVIRPDDLEHPNGFGVLIARTPRRIEASFRADSFSRRLLRSMGQADSDAREAFAELARLAAARGFRVIASVNGNPVEDLRDLPREEWGKLEIDCDVMLPVGKISEIDLRARALEVASVCVGLVLSLLVIEDIVDVGSAYEEGLPEGAKMRVEVNRYERSPVNRNACIAYFGMQCTICGFDFLAFYGELGRDFIEVHHTTPVSSLGGSYQVDPKKDLVPVCPNCHAMLHRKTPPLSIEELREIIDEKISEDRT